MCLLNQTSSALICMRYQQQVQAFEIICFNERFTHCRLIDYNYSESVSLLSLLPNDYIVTENKYL